MRYFIKLFLLWIGSIFHRNHKSKILFYHDIYSSINYKALDVDMCMGTHIDMFKKHVEVIRKEGFEIVSEITRPEGQVAIMLDDGFRGIYEVREYFYKNKIFPTIFLPAGHLGKDCLLSNEEILDLQEHGFKFESHGWSHEDLTSFDTQGLGHELNDARSYLSKLLKKDVSELCLPIGYFSDKVIKMALKAGYSTIYSSIPGNYDKLVHGSLRTRNLLQFATPLQVRYVLRGGNELIRSRYERMHYKKA